MSVKIDTPQVANRWSCSSAKLRGDEACRRGLICTAQQGKTARVWLQGKGGGLKPGQAALLLPPKEGETDASPIAYCAPLRQALIDENAGHVNVLVCETDYRALKRGIEHLPPPPQ